LSTTASETTLSSRSWAASATQAGVVVVLGNPNVGKTTLFNALTGQNERVGNYPGITVERRSGSVTSAAGTKFELVDVPGAYSLSARSLEEQVALDAALGLNGNPKPSLAVVVVDAGQLIRNLYLVLQLVEFQVPLLVVLTMLDEVSERPPSPDRVGQIFGLPCIGVNPRSKAGVEQLREAIAHVLKTPPRGDAAVTYPAALRKDIDRVADFLPRAWRSNVEHDRALATWALLSSERDDELSLPVELREVCETVRVAANEVSRDLDLEIIGARYAFIDAAVANVYADVPLAHPMVDWTERLDRVLLHPGYGFAIFIVLMLGIFQSLFSWADPAIAVIEAAVSWLQETALAYLSPGFISDLVIQGVLGGLGNVVVFLPQIVLLFLMVGLLEDSGYMARVAYLMDRVLRGVGLHGKAFVPMLSGLACAVPAIMATRTMERRRDRLLTMMVVPLMSCSARLPVYALIVGALFPPSHVFGLVPVQGLLMVGMYLFSTLTTLAAAWVLGRTVVRGQRVPLILELPRYRWPSLKDTLRMVWHRTQAFLVEAGTVILGFTILLWLLLSYPKPPQSSSTAVPQAQTEISATAAPTNTAQAAVTPQPLVPEPTPIEYSFAGRFGKAIAPATAPLGFDWKLTIGIVGAFSAREVFVSTMGLVFGLDGNDDAIEPLRESMRAETRSDGKPAYPPLVGLSLMVFFALACQCMSTIAVVRRETQSWRWPALLFVYMTTLAYVASLIVYQGGRLLGFAG
jgi:ferrous iron transport protein B